MLDRQMPRLLLATSISYSSLIAPLTPRGCNPLIHFPGVGRWETHVFSCQLEYQCVSVWAASETRTWVCVVYLRNDARCTGKEGVSKTRKRREPIMGVLMRGGNGIQEPSGTF